MKTLEQFSLRGRTALVTGASYGLGARFAEVLAEAGATVVLMARSTDKLAAVAARVERHGVRALPLPGDVTAPDQVQRVVATAWEQCGRVDVLVNNAGVVAEAGFLPERVPDTRFARTIATNLTGLFTCCREVGARQLADGSGGVIVNIASVGGLAGQALFPPAYQASKAAVINLTRNLAASWAGRGIRVNALAPGWFASEMTAPFFKMSKMRERVERTTPMGRHGAEHELDAALLFLASDASSFVTGATLVVDGGASATIGGVDYDDETFAQLAEVAGERGTRIMPTE